MLDIQIENLDEFLQKFKSLDVQKTLNTSIKKSIILLEGESKKNTNVDKGFLVGGYEIHFNNLEGKLINIRHYGVYVHEGTKYYKGNPFITNAVETSNEDINRFFNKDINKMLNSLKV